MKTKMQSLAPVLLGVDSMAATRLKTNEKSEFINKWPELTRCRQL
jgi:hypothetical protein